MLYEDVDFKTISDRYTKKSHATVPHTYWWSQSKFIRQKMTPTKVNQQLFFIVKLDPTNSSPSNTAKVRHIYLKLICVFHETSKTTCRRECGWRVDYKNLFLYLRFFHKELMGHIMRKPVILAYVNNKGADQPALPRSLISIFVVRCLDSNEILQLKAI